MPQNISQIVNPTIDSALMMSSFNEDESFAARRVFLPHGSPKRSLKFGSRTDRKLRINDLKVDAAGKPPVLIRDTISARTVDLVDRAFLTEMNWDEIEGADDAVTAQSEWDDLMIFCAEQHKLALELDFVSKCAAGNFATGASGNSSATWGTLAGLVPNASAKAYTDVNGALEGGRTLIGKRFPALFFTHAAWQLFCLSAEVTGYIKTTMPGQPTVGSIETVKAALGVRTLIIGGAHYNNVADGPAEGFTGASAYGAAASHFVLAFNDEAPSRQSRGFGYFVYQTKKDNQNPVTGDGAPRIVDPFGGDIDFNIKTENKIGPDRTKVATRARWSLEFGTVDDPLAATPKARGGYRLNPQIT